MFLEVKSKEFMDLFKRNDYFLHEVTLSFKGKPKNLKIIRYFIIKLLGGYTGDEVEELLVARSFDLLKETSRAPDIIKSNPKLRKDFEEYVDKIEKYWSNKMEANNVS
jgi:hypothetical protein